MDVPAVSSPRRLRQQPPADVDWVTASVPPGPSASDRPHKGENTETSVKVVVRFRPHVGDEELQEAPAFVVNPNGRAVDSVDGSFHFDLDHVFSEASTQEDIYNHLGRPIIDGVLKGYNGTILAFGQTGSGKTHSMIGPQSGIVQDSQQGIVPRAAQQIFDYIAGGTDASSEEVFADDTEFTLRCSFLEVYCEQLRDLLNPGNQKLRVKESPLRGLYVDGLVPQYVTCKAEVLNILRTGSRNRAVARTRLNHNSSRSHGIFSLHVEQRSVGESADGSSERLGKLTLVDLAGSEKASKSECVGETLEEAKKINWSLSALGKVIDALAEQRSHVPYRDSKLTRVMEEALGGNCRTSLLVNVSAASQHYDETLSSLRFASRTQKVRNHAKVNYMYSSDQLLTMVTKLQKELVSAKQKISTMSISPLPNMQGSSRSKSRRQLSASPGAERRGSPKRRPPSCSLRDEAAEFAPTLQSVSGGANPSSDWLASCGSARSLESSCSRRSSEQSSGGEDHDPDFEAWKSMALAARETIASLEVSLASQEQALEQAGLLRQSFDEASKRSSQEAPEVGVEKSVNGDGKHMDALSERFRALRHAVDARRLHWRLVLERYRADRLSQELDMRQRYTQDLEKSLEEANARLHEALDSHRAESGARCGFSGFDADCPAAISRARGGSPQAPPVAATASQQMRRANSSGTGAIGRSSPTSASGGSLTQVRRRGSSRIKRPVPRPVRASSQATALSGLHPTSSPRSAAFAAGEAGASPVSFDDGTPQFAAACRAVPPTASLGDTGGVAGAGFPSDLRVESDRAAVSPAASTYAEAHLELLQADLSRKSAHVAELSNELVVRDIRLAALRHEVTVNEVLVKKLTQDLVELAEERDDSEDAEELLEQAMTALMGVLTRDQLATAAAHGERAVVPRQPEFAPSARQWPEQEAH